MTDRICRNCEYWDGGGEIPAKTAVIGDCLNRASPRFTTEPTFTCDQFYPSTTNEDTDSGRERASVPGEEEYDEPDETTTASPDDDDDETEGFVGDLDLID